MRACTLALCAVSLLLLVTTWSACAAPADSQVKLNSDASAGNWPQWRGPQRDGVSQETGLQMNWETRPPELLWMGDGLGRGYASVAVAGGRIFTTGNTSGSQDVVAVSVENGNVLWKTPVTDSAPKHSYEGSRSTPTVDGDRLYAVSSDGAIVCLQVADGRELWRRDFSEWNGRMMSGWGFAESPLVDGDRVICTPGGRDAMMVALDKNSGSEIWRAAAPPTATVRGEQLKQGAGYSSAVISNGAGVKQYVQLIGGGVVGVRAEDGQLLWNYSDIANRTANIPTPITYGDYVFASTGYHGGAALLKLIADAHGVKAEEQYYLSGEEFQNHHGGMVLVDGDIYAGHGHTNGFPVCLEMKTGEVVWGGSTRGAGSGSAAVVAAADHIIFRYQSGEVASVEATPERYNLKGTLMPEFQEDRSWAHPVVAGGRLYLREQDKLMCYELR